MFFPVLGLYIADLPEQYKVAMQKARFHHIPGRDNDGICFRCRILHFFRTIIELTQIEKKSIDFDEEVTDEDLLLQVCNLTLLPYAKLYTDKTRGSFAQWYKCRKVANVCH